MKRENKALFTINMRVHFRGTMYEFRLERFLKWLGVTILLGYRLYHQLRGAAP